MFGLIEVSILKDIYLIKHGKFIKGYKTIIRRRAQVQGEGTHGRT